MTCGQGLRVRATCMLVYASSLHQLPGQGDHGRHALTNTGHEVACSLFIGPVVPAGLPGMLVTG